MLSHADSVRIRVSLLLSGITGLVPALAVKGRENDPMRYASWWSGEHHSAVLVVGVGAVLGALCVLMLGRRGFWKWWTFAAFGAAVGMFPSWVYLLVTAADTEWLPLLLAMLIVGAIWGAMVFTVLFFILKPGVVKSGP